MIVRCSSWYCHRMAALTNREGLPACDWHINCSFDCCVEAA